MMRHTSDPVRVSIAATKPSFAATKAVAPAILISRGKLTGPMRLAQACFAETSPLTACSGAGCGLAGPPPKSEKDEQPTKVAAPRAEKAASTVRVEGRNDGNFISSPRGWKLLRPGLLRLDPSPAS